MNAEALAEWHRFTPLLRDSGLISHLDRNMVGAYFTIVATLAEAQAAIIAGGATYATATGFIRASPWIGIQNAALKLLTQYSSEFGLTPQPMCACGSSWQKKMMSLRIFWSVDE